jgi:hypothetical protein
MATSTIMSATVIQGTPGIVQPTHVISTVRGCQNSNGFNINATTCFCENGYGWNSTSQTCSIDCTSIFGSNGSNATSGGCNCLYGYYWSSSDGARCIRNCSSILYTNGTSTTDPTVCYCKNGYVDDGSGNACVLNCTGMPYSTGERKSNGECKCHGGYHWDKRIAMCTSKTGSNSVGVGVGVGVGVPVGLALLGLLAYLALSGKKKPLPPVITPVLVNQPAPLATSTVVRGPPVTSIVAPPVAMGPSMISPMPPPVSTTYGVPVVGTSMVKQGGVVTSNVSMSRPVINGPGMFGPGMQGPPLSPTGYSPAPLSPIGTSRPVIPGAPMATSSVIPGMKANFGGTSNVVRRF